MSCTGNLNCWIDLLVAMQLAFVALHLPALAVLQCAATVASLVSSTACNYALSNAYLIKRHTMH